MMLKDFVSLLPELYGEQNCTANAHMLLHLPMYVRLWGPLWTHSTFAFESKNGHLKKLSHGKSSFYQQMLFNIDVSQTLQLIQPIIDDTDSPMQTILRSNLDMGALQDKVCIGQHTYFLNGPSIEKPNADEKNALDCTGRIVKYKKLLKHGVLYCASTKKTTKRDSRVCAFRDPSSNTVKLEKYYHLCTPHNQYGVTKSLSSYIYFEGRWSNMQRVS